MTETPELVQLAGDARSVVDCRVNPIALVGHVTTTFASEGSNVNCGEGNERLNTVPLPEPPPDVAVP